MTASRVLDVIRLRLLEKVVDFFRKYGIIDLSKEGESK